MRDGGRISATLEVLADFDARRVPLKVCLADWARGARYAGAKDRAFISGLALDILRRRRSLSAHGAEDRGAIAHLLVHQWGWSVEQVTAAFAEAPHGPGQLTGEEVTAMTADPSADMAPAALADVPDFVFPLMERITDDPIALGQASAVRAPVDLRINSLKASRDKVVRALSAAAPEASPLLTDGLRLQVEAAALRAPNITTTEAYQKGWVEVQDFGSQLAALAVGEASGKQVLDLCAGGGGKTLALSALMNNTGQIFAYDVDAHRLAPIHERLRRAGARNVQVLGSDPESLTPLSGRMDIVLVDAPCSGMGTWRRKPDTKWRLTPQQLARRQAEQDQVLETAAGLVKPGGEIIYVTCSLLAEENEDRIGQFLAVPLRADHSFELLDPREAINASGRAAFPDQPSPYKSSEFNTLRLSPDVHSTDGFSITRLRATAQR